MSALLDLHPDTGHPAVVAVREIHDLLDDLLDDLDVSAPLPAGGYAALVADCDRAVTRLQALKLKLLAAADKAEVALDAGMPGTSAWLAGTPAPAAPTRPARSGWPPPWTRTCRPPPPPSAPAPCPPRTPR